MVKCSKCGKDLRLGIDAYCHGELILCKDCNEKIGKAEQEKIEIGEDITKTSYLKQNLVKTETSSEISLPDLQLQEIRQIKNDVSTIKNIMLFFLILFIIMFAIYILIAFYTLPI